MKNKPENPAAYPVGSSHAKHCLGMTLRDYFAGQALANSQMVSDDDSPPGVAEYTYRIADAMLKEREKDE